ncbi:LAME_0D05534g1_1 [Lachancea meyersii CBS 8951]|uniref:LAME_0D05534g1_1 n=1 Tax=Lachancea meyersii CBS 8951 TaxID=1266667 RepID=A0A1G4J8N3_9SACH|nr:LAME_0D05534g1_1 [Lachancea meyersii CBS 8951]
MSNGSERSNSTETPSVVKKRSLSNYLSNIQKRKQELEQIGKKKEGSKEDDKGPTAGPKCVVSDHGRLESKGAVTNSNDGSTGDSRTSVNVNINETKSVSQEKSIVEEPLKKDVADSEAKMPAIPQNANLASASEQLAEEKPSTPKDRQDSGEIKANAERTDENIIRDKAVGNIQDAQSNSMLPKSLENMEPKKPASHSNVSMKGDMEEPVLEPHVVKQEVQTHTEHPREQESNSKLTKTKLVSMLRTVDQNAAEHYTEDEESELSEVESDAPTEPASPPRPRLGRLVRGDQLRSSPRRIPRLHSANSDESELSDLDELNQVPLSSSILHGDSPPDRTSHFNLKSSPMASLKRSHASPTHARAYTAMRKQLKPKKSGVHRDAGGRTKLQISCDKGKYDNAKRLIQEGFNVNDQDNAGNSSLHEAALNGHLDIVELLLENGADINIQSYEPIKDTPLIDAAANRHLDVVKLLLKFNADPTISNAKGLTAIESIEEDSDLDDEEVNIVEGLKRELKKAMERSTRGDDRRARSSSYTRNSDTDRSSSNIRMEDEFYWTDISSKLGREKLLRASKEGRLPYVGAYLENGGRVDYKSFIEAVKYGHEDITSLFLAFGAQANMTTREGQTPLMIALGRGHQGTVKLLLEAGADPTMPDKNGRSVLSYAKHSDLGLKSKQEVEMIQEALALREKQDAHMSSSESETGEELRTKESSTKRESRKPSTEKVTKEDSFVPEASVSSPRSPNLSRKRSSTAEQEERMRLPRKEDAVSNIATRESPEVSMANYALSVTHKKPKLERSWSPGASELISDAQRSQNTTPTTSNTPKPAETTEDKEQRLKAEQEYRQKRLLNKKRKEQELLLKLAEDERKRAEERDRQNAQQMQRVQEEKAKAAREEELQRASVELERRRRIRTNYPLGLRLIDFQATDDLTSFLPLYYVVLDGRKHVLDLQMCVLLKDVAFPSKHSDGGHEVSQTHKTQIWSIYKFIFLSGGRHSTDSSSSQVQNAIELLPFKARAELESQERDRFLRLPLHWIAWDSITVTRDLESRKPSIQDQMVEISLQTDDANLSVHFESPSRISNTPSSSSKAEDLQTNLIIANPAKTTQKRPFFSEKYLPPRLRNRPSITNLLKGSLPSW